MVDYDGFLEKLLNSTSAFKAIQASKDAVTGSIQSNNAPLLKAVYWATLEVTYTEEYVRDVQYVTAYLNEQQYLNRDTYGLRSYTKSVTAIQRNDIKNTWSHWNMLVQNAMSRLPFNVKIEKLVKVDPKAVWSEIWDWVAKYEDENSTLLLDEIARLLRYRVKKITLYSSNDQHDICMQTLREAVSHANPDIQHKLRCFSKFHFDECV